MQCSQERQALKGTPPAVRVDSMSLNVHNTGHELGFCSVGDEPAIPDRTHEKKKKLFQGSDEMPLVVNVEDRGSRTPGTRSPHSLNEK